MSELQKQKTRKKKSRGNGEGSIFERNLRGKKKWVVQYPLGKKENGKQKYKTIYCASRTEAKEKYKELITNLNTGKYIDKSKITLINLINKNIEEDFALNKISSSSYNRKKETKTIIENSSIGNVEIQNLDPITINDFLLSIKNYSNSVIIKVSQMIRKAFDKAIILNIVSNNPYNIKGLINIPKSNKEDKKITALTIEEQKLFTKELEKNYDEYSNIFLLLIYTGMRVGEVLALSPIDIDLKNDIIHINKTLTKDSNDKYIVGSTTKTYAGTRDIPITSLIKNTLLEVKNCQNDTFFNNNGKIIAPNTINSHFKRICKNAGIRIIKTKRKKNKKIDNGSKTKTQEVNLKSSNVNTHMLRHTYATRCIESGMSAVVLSKLIGHADIETTLNTYTSVFNKFKEDEIKKYLNYINNI